MQPLQAIISTSVRFEDLCHSRDGQTGAVSFDLRPIQAICAANGLDFDALVNNGNAVVCALIDAWYEAHLRIGGAPSSVQDELRQEARFTAERGGGFLYAPGHA